MVTITELSWAFIVLLFLFPTSTSSLPKCNMFLQAHFISSNVNQNVFDVSRKIYASIVCVNGGTRPREPTNCICYINRWMYSKFTCVRWSNPILAMDGHKQTHSLVLGIVRLRLVIHNLQWQVTGLCFWIMINMVIIILSFHFMLVLYS